MKRILKVCHHCLHALPEYRWL